MPNRPKTVLQVQPRRPLGRPKAEDLASLEARLLDVAREAFFKKGYGATTMDSVAMAARVSKATLYSRFPSKDTLFRALVEDWLAKWGTQPVIIPGKDFETLEKALQTYGDICVRAALSHDFAQINRLVFGESQRFPELGDAMAAAVNLGVETMIDIIEEFGRRDGVPCKDSRLVAEVFQAIMGGWTTHLIMTNEVLTAEARTAWINNTVRIFIASRAAW
jgi:TetR/AcrR family transcriptional repressor of mexJK operon